uniref:Max-binding protein MNT n=1 Tax=Neogobius melanostomus TaxID=47308 RepID=A0A8C6SMI1_9GOBI
MSIETLLEAAKFLELQALQQQKARDDDFKEKLLQEQLREPKTPDVPNSTLHFNNVKKAKECRPTLSRPPMPSPSVPITVIPVPVATPNHTGSPPLPLPPPITKTEALFPQDQNLSGLPRSPQPRPEQHPTSAPGAGRTQPLQNHQPHFVAQTANTNFQQQSLHHYTGSIVSPSLPQAFLPHSGTFLQQAPFQNGAISGSSPLDDSRLLDSKKRSGGAGTREVHNKLEKNRRAHLKECFETLKKNIPNVDEKKTSNLSVLRSALRYIQTLKRKEKEYEHDMERLAREKIATQQRLAELKNDLSQWMDVVEIDRVVRQTVQPEEDQASTSTASEGGDIIDDDLDDEMELEPCTPPAASQAIKPELPKAIAPHEKPAHAPIASCFAQRKASPPPPPRPLLKPAPPLTVTATLSSSTSVTSPVLSPVVSVSASVLHPTVIAHSSVSHPSVIQTLNHVIQTPKHLAHLAPSTTSGPVHLTSAQPPISLCTVHPVTHLPTLYSQPLAVAHALSHAHPQLNGAGQASPAGALVGKHTAMGAQMVTHHTQLVGQTVLNPVTMVTMPSFPISTLKLA